MSFCQFRGLCLHLIVKWLKWFNACEDTDTLKIEYEDSDSDEYED